MTATLSRHVALVSESAETSISELSTVASVLERQVVQDLAPLWGVHGTVSWFPDLESVPTGYWPVIVVDGRPEATAPGGHVDRHGQPFAVVRSSANWSLAASHMVLEMLIDPWGNRLVPGRSPVVEQGPVQFLLAACDPCADTACAYAVDGILVSDFTTPAYVESRSAPGTRYSFTGAITRPLEVLPGGCLSWFDPASRQVWQENHFGSEPEVRALGVGERVFTSFREWVDARTRMPVSEPGAAVDQCRVGRLADEASASRSCSAARAHSLRMQMRELARRAT